ncbi:MAG: hypothetical protein WA137_01905 [Methanothrix sp.]
MMQERFCQFWAGKPDTPEGHLAEAHRRAQSAFELMQTELVRCIRVEKKGDKLIPIFSDDAAIIAGPHWDTEKRLLDIKADIEAFLGLTEGEPGLSTLLDKISRAKRILNEVEHVARVELERAVRKGATSINDSPEFVQALFDKRDRLRVEMGPEINNLEGKISAAKAILNKY